MGSGGSTPLKFTKEAEAEASEPLLKDPPVPPPVRFAPFGWREYGFFEKLIHHIQSK